MSRVLELLAEYRARALARESIVARDLTRRWLRIEAVLKTEVEVLAQEVSAMVAAGVKPTAGRLWELERMRSLLAQTQAQQRAFADYAAGLISREQYVGAAEGIEYGVDSVRAALSSAGIEASFTTLPVDAINAMIGFTADGTPLHQLLVASYPEMVTTITDALVHSMVVGANPRKTARLIRDAMAGNLQRALVVARTEALRAERVATVQQYQASGVVSGYRRHAVRAPRTCLACLLLDGTFYSVSEQFSDHPNGRCFCTPELVGIPSPITETGKEWFLSRDPEAQRVIMGDNHYQAWRSGEVPLEAMARMHTDPVWGEAPQIVPLKELLPPMPAAEAAE